MKLFSNLHISKIVCIFAVEKLYHEATFHNGIGSLTPAVFLQKSQAPLCSPYIVYVRYGFEIKYIYCTISE